LLDFVRHWCDEDSFPLTGRIADLDASPIVRSCSRAIGELIADPSG
jgi:hypothetical protein